jgi:heterodisulfide reductase subunit A
MVIFATPFRPQDDAAKVAETFGIPLSDSGFFAKEQHELSSVITPKKGIFIAGCATGPKDIQDSVIHSQAAAGRVLSLYYQSA